MRISCKKNRHLIIDFFGIPCDDPKQNCCPAMKVHRRSKLEPKTQAARSLTNHMERSAIVKPSYQSMPTNAPHGTFGKPSKYYICHVV